MLCDLFVLLFHLLQSSDTVAEQGCFIADLTSRDKDHVR